MVRKRTYLAALTLAAATAGVAAPAQAGPAQDVKLVTAGYEHRCLVTTGGDAYCWGWNAYGQLGDGTTRDRATPVKVVGLGGKATAIVAGQTNTCAIIEGGAVKCWGSNSFGELGNGTHTPSTVPVQVKGLISGWAGIGLGWSTTCARNSSGMVKCWGDNSFGQLGTGSSAYESLVPVTVHEMSSGVARFGIGAFTGCGLSAGALRCWGSNDTGSLGTGSGIAESRVPVPVPSLGRSVRSVSADGDSATVCVITTAGAAKCWGHNYAGNVGNGSMSYAVPTPAQVVGLTSDVSSIAVGEGTTCAVRRGALLCWGDGDKGSRASGDQRDSLTPAPAKVLTSGVTQLAMGSMGGCAVKARRAYCWGTTAYGQPVSLAPRLVTF